MPPRPVESAAVPFPMGWIPDPRAVDRYLSQARHPLFGAAAANLKESGKDKVVLLHPFLEAACKAIGKGYPLIAQGIGDCVSHGWAMGVMTYLATMATLRKEGMLPGYIATEDIYAGSRIEIGRGQCGTEDGSVGAWAAEYVQDYGVLIRAKYGDHDLTEYDPKRAKAWGRPKVGVPDDLEPIAREHPIQTVSMVTTYEEARDALANGYPVPVCSKRGFTMQRDQDGFALPSGRWGHCMCFIAVDDAFKRPGLLCQNSWGPDWISGPTRHDQPPGSFWVDAETVTSMLREQDSYAISGVGLFPANEIDHSQY